MPPGFVGGGGFTRSYMAHQHAGRASCNGRVSWRDPLGAGFPGPPQRGAGGKQEDSCAQAVMLRVRLKACRLDSGFCNRNVLAGQTPSSAVLFRELKWLTLKTVLYKHQSLYLFLSACSLHPRSEAGRPVIAISGPASKVPLT